MKTVYDVEPETLIQTVADQLESEYEEVEQPDWAAYVKTGVHKERPPQQENWWYLRSAAVLRQIYKRGPIGTQRLRSVYGGKHRRGHNPEHFARGSGKVIRTVLQQLEAAGLVEQQDNQGRNLTPEGQSFMDQAAKTAAE